MRLQNEMNSFSDKTINDLLDHSEIPKGQCELIREIYLAAKVKSPKNRNYTENWTLLCLLFQIR